MVVAIDGPAGTGKSSVSRCVARETRFFYVNSGRFYRAITWKALSEGLSPDDHEALLGVARAISIEVRPPDTYLVDGHPRHDELHTPGVDAQVAQVSAIPPLREEVNRRLLVIAAERDIIVEGRDITTVVFPDADVKVFLDASVEERARRRWEQSDQQLTLAQTRDAIARRDGVDRSKETERLYLSGDALYVDTTHLTLEVVCEKVVATIRQKQINDSRST